MTKITAAERVFLSRAEAVTEKKRTRAAHYEQQLQVLMAERQPGNMSKLSKQILKIATQHCASKTLHTLDNALYFCFYLF